MRPVLAWLVFVLVVSAPSAPLVHLAVRAADAEETRARVELIEAQAANATALEREVQLSIFHAAARLGELEPGSTVGDVDGALRAASLPFADWFVLRARDGELLIPARGGRLDVPGANGAPSRRATIQAILAANIAAIRMDRSLRGWNGGLADPTKTRMLRVSGALVMVRALASGLEVGWIIDDVSVVSGLRTKIEQDPKEPVHIVTVRGAGYRFKR